MLECRPRSVLAQMTHANVAAVLAGLTIRDAPRIVVTEQAHLTKTSQLSGGLRYRLQPAFARLTYRRADGVVAVSEGVADDLAQRARIPRSKVEVVPNPLDIDAISQRALEPPDHPWLVERDAPVVLAVGRLHLQKGFDTLVDAFARVRKKRSARLLILGDGDERAALEAQIARLGLQEDVQILGFRANPYAYLGRADLFVLSSLFEGMPTVLLEAAVLGRPVVSTDCPSGPAEIFGADAQRLVPVEDVERLAGAMSAALADPAGHTLDFDSGPYRRESVADGYARVLEL
jgi:glycosyltransferase involved in cell wall biosynthesis